MQKVVVSDGLGLVLRSLKAPKSTPFLMGLVGILCGFGFEFLEWQPG